MFFFETRELFYEGWELFYELDFKPPQGVASGYVFFVSGILPNLIIVRGLQIADYADFRGFYPRIARIITNDKSK